MLFTIIFKSSYGAIYEGHRIEADSKLQAVADAARKSKYSKLCCVTEEEGLLKYADDKIIPLSFHCSHIPLVELFCNANVKFTELEVPVTDKNRNKKENEYEEEDFILAIRNILLRETAEIIPPNHIMVGIAMLKWRSRIPIMGGMTLSNLIMY